MKAVGTIAIIAHLKNNGLNDGKGSFSANVSKKLNRYIKIKYLNCDKHCFKLLQGAPSELSKKKMCTIGSKIIRALAIIFMIFLCFDCKFLSSHACYKQYKA